MPLVVAVPLLAAAALAAVAQLASRRLADLVAIAASLAVSVMSVLLIFRSDGRTIDYWFGGWRPRGGIALGLSFSVDPLSAAVAALVATLATAALIVSWDYFDGGVPRYFCVLVLAFEGAMVGFTLSSDLFNMFVFFELMSVGAFALTGYRIEQPSALQGAVNFAVVNSIGAFLVLTGIALLYGRTGALNLAQIGQVLPRGKVDGLVVIAFAVLTVGFLTKAGAVPFHFWLSDAYAVAPAPVCIVFAGVMSDLGLHGVGRIYWEGFSGVLGGHAEAIRAVLVGLGVLAAVLGAVMAFVESSLKRMLAFIVISHVGVFLAAIGLLTARSFAAASVYVVADGLVKGAIFCGVASLARATGHTDELRGFGSGRRLPRTIVLMLIGALGLAVLPPFGTFLGFSMLAQSARAVGYGWLPVVLAGAAAISAGAILRSCARIFGGLGPRRDESLEGAPPGEEAEVPPTPRSGLLLWGPGLLLLVAGLGLAFVPGLASSATAHAARFVDRAAFVRETLHEVPAPPLHSERFHVSALSYAYGAATVAAALGFAVFGLYRRRLPAPLRKVAACCTDPAITRLKLVHDGVVGDYVAWLAFGTAGLGAVLALVLR